MPAVGLLDLSQTSLPPERGLRWRKAEERRADPSATAGQAGGPATPSTAEGIGGGWPEQDSRLPPGAVLAPGKILRVGGSGALASFLSSNFLESYPGAARKQQLACPCSLSPLQPQVPTATLTPLTSPTVPASRQAEG